MAVDQFILPGTGLAYLDRFEEPGVVRIGDILHDYSIADRNAANGIPVAARVLPGGDSIRGYAKCSILHALCTSAKILPDRAQSCKSVKPRPDAG